MIVFSASPATKKRRELQVRVSSEVLAYLLQKHKTRSRALSGALPPVSFL